MTSKELVKATLEFRNTTQRVPRDLWELPWAKVYHPKELDRLHKDFVWDFKTVKPTYFVASAVERGFRYDVGEYVDPWGCHFKNIQKISVK